MTKELEIRSSISEDAPVPKSSAKYPIIILDQPTDELSVLIAMLPRGDLQLALPVKGGLRMVKLIERSPETLNMILKIRPLTVRTSKETAITITRISELLDMESFSWT